MLMFMRRSSKGGGGGRTVSSASRPSEVQRPAPLISPSFRSEVTSSASSFLSPALQGTKSGGHRGRSRGDGCRDRFSYRSQLEQEVQKMEKQLQEEINLRTILANGTAHNTEQMFTSFNLPIKVLDLLSSVATLEIAVSKLEEDLIFLHFCLSQERNEHHYNECLSMDPPAVLQPSQLCSSDYSWEQKLSPLGMSQFSQAYSSQPVTIADNGCLSSNTSKRIDICSEHADTGMKEEVSTSCSLAVEENQINGTSLQKVDENDMAWNLWRHPNKLSEEMVRCMRNIFLRLSESSAVYSRNCMCHSSSPDVTSKGTFDPYIVNWKETKIAIGIYGSAAEVSWMTVGKKQLEYASEALKRFRCLVEQLAKVDPATMHCNERLAFWINLYNALIMHAYLAYGVPRSDMKFFALMQKASYTVGGHLLTAVDIQYVILKMKPPAHRPQIALVLALHKFKMSEEHIFSIETPEPLLLFALSCGTYSSPAVRIFTPKNINGELQSSMKDYIQASVGINDKGKLLVPKLLHCFAKGIVEDSLLVDWICRFLSPEQVSVVRDSTSQWKQRLLGARSFSILPFDSRFRYLFLPDKDSSTKSS